MALALAASNFALAQVRGNPERANPERGASGGSAEGPVLTPGGAFQQPPAAPATDAVLEEATLPYRTTIAATGNAELDTALNAVSQLIALQQQAPTSTLGVIGRANADRARFQQALQSEGYWAGTARILLAGQELGGTGLAERLEATTERPLPIAIAIETGPLYRVASIATRAAAEAEQPAVDTAAAAPFGLRVGDPAKAAPVLAAERQLVDRLLAAGHPLATTVRRDTVVDHDRRIMEVGWVFSPGPLARFATPQVVGAVRMDPGFLNRQASAALTDQPYSPATLEKARTGLQGLGVFGSVRTRAASQLDADGRLPVTFEVEERPLRALGASAAYETNYGPSVRVYWEHRNLFGGAERLRLEAEVARIGTSGSSGMTYRVGGTLTDPGMFGRNINLVASLFAVQERLEAFDRDAALLSAIFEKRISDPLTLRAGPVAEVGQIGPSGGPPRAYQVAGILFGGRWNTTDSLLDPVRGLRAEASITPSYSLRDASAFAPFRVTGSTYWDVLGDRRTVLAVRGSLGILLGADRLNVPQSQRFYAGGGGSVRGYDYQSIGPRTPAGKPAGGSSLVEASIELRQRIYGDFGAVAFLDAGAVGSSTSPDFSNLRVGAGLGVRYYSVVGPIRADFAVPLVRQQGSSGYGIYVGIGQAF